LRKEEERRKTGRNLDGDGGITFFHTLTSVGIRGKGEKKDGVRSGGGVGHAKSGNKKPLAFQKTRHPLLNTKKKNNERKEKRKKKEGGGKVETAQDGGENC